MNMLANHINTVSSIKRSFGLLVRTDIRKEFPWLTSQIPESTNRLRTQKFLLRPEIKHIFLVQ